MALGLSLMALLGSPAAAAAEAPEPAGRRVEWRPEWRRANALDYGLTAVLWGGGVWLRLAGPEPPERSWQLPGEDAIADALAVRGSGLDTVVLISDIAFYGSFGYRVLDSALTPGIGWNAWDVSQQLLVIDLQSLGLTAAVFWVAQATVGRERPPYRDCPEQAPPGGSCDSDSDERYRSFIAGHLAMATAAASLTCLHHAKLPLYGGGVADDLACATTIGAATASGVTRLLSENHYASDILLGAGLGVLGGYVWPKLLYYGFGGPDPEPPREASRYDPRQVSLMVAPSLELDSPGVRVLGLF